MDSEAKDVLQNSELTARLLRRQSDSPGVIDLQHPQQEYARTAGWVAQRYALLGHLNNRYGFTEDNAQSRQPLVVGESLKESTGAFSGAAQTIPSVMRSSKSITSPVSNPLDSSADSSGSSTGTFRIRRLPAQLALKPDTSKPQGATSKAVTDPAKSAGAESIEGQGSSGRASTDHNSSAFSTRTSAVNTWSGSSDDSSVQSAVLKSPQISSSRGSVSAPGGQLIMRKAATEKSGEPREKHLPGATGSGSAPTGTGSDTGLIEQQSGEASAAKARLESSGDSTAHAGGRLILRKAATDKAGEPLEKPALSAMRDYPERADASRAAAFGLAEGEGGKSSSPLTFAKPQAAPPMIQRQVQGSQTDASQSTNEAASREEKHQPAVASEIRSRSPLSSRPGIIWRKSANGQAAGISKSTGSTGNALAVARQVDNTASTSVPSQGAQQIAPSATADPAESSEIDLGQITEQVIRAISRKLAVDRERRGIRR